MTSELFVLTCIMLVAGASRSPVVAATSTLDRLQIPAAVYHPLAPPQSRTRRSLFGHLLAHPYDDDVYAAEDSAAPVKRGGNGAWIWMPAQGYVSVSNSQQASGGDVSGKHGRIMRYGK